MVYLLASEGLTMSDEELKETKVEEQQPEQKPEEAKEDINKIFPAATPIEKPTKDSKPYDEAIEEARLIFFNVVKKGRIRSYIAMAVVLALAVGSVVCIGMKSAALKIVGWALVGVAVVGMLVFFIVTHNLTPNATKAYIATVNKELNQRNFADNQFTDCSTDEKERLELADPISDAIYCGLTTIASRNVIRGYYAGRSFKLCDLGLYSGQGKGRTSAFVGKYFSYPNDLHFEGRYILVFKGQAPVDLPTDLADLEVLHEEEPFMVYGKKDAKYEKDLGKEFLAGLRKVRVENHLLNLNVVVWSGHTAVYASYDDPIMTLPYQQNYNKEPNEQYANDILNLFIACSMLLKKEK